ncbi:MAG: type V CRISPR-associated protein Cas12b [Deferrisomatales bacterium]|nr:type V CRISPR-associated protein Cas12b [Deferrisomatales bacterium]
MDPDSEAGAADSALLGAFHDLLLDRRAEDGFWTEAGEGWAAAARARLAEHPALLRRPGSPPRWLREHRAGNAGWAGSLYEALQRKFDSPMTRVYIGLHALHALPICAPFGAGRVAPSSGRLTKFERLAMAHAVGHLNAWESWCHRAEEQQEERRARVREWDRQHAASHGNALHCIRAFEREQTARLRELSPGLGKEATYTLLPRTLRNWDRLRKWLQAHPGASATERSQRLLDLRTARSRGSGGEEVLSWLANPERQWLAEHPAGDVVSAVALRNAWSAAVARTRLHPTFTAADERLHPRYVEFDPPKNSNQPSYELLEREEGALAVKLRLLSYPPDGGGPLQEEAFVFKLAASGQARNARVRRVDLKSGKTDLVLARRSQDGLDQMDSPVGGSALLLSRVHLEKSADDSLGSGEIGPVYLKVAVDVGSELQDALRKREKARNWFNCSLPERYNAQRGSEPPTGTVRVLAVDLGLRTAASVSIGSAELADAGRLVAYRHERSASLTLPGDRASREQLVKRRAAWERLGEVRRGIRYLAQIRHLCCAETKDARQEVLDEVVRASAEEALRAGLSEEQIDTLQAGCIASSPTWRASSSGIYRDVERRLGLEIQQWRTEAKDTRARRNVWGKSAEGVEYLAQTHRALLAWHRHQPPWREAVQSSGRSTRGAVGKNLREHLNNLKSDRARSTADLVVQAARGLVYREGKWEKRFAPVDIIVMEDLNRYLLRTDRPRAENRQLMQWLHREIRAQVEMQAEVYGIASADTAAGFSSRFDANSMAPGVRCQAATKEDVETLNKGAATWLSRTLGRAGVAAARIQPGDLLPIGSGDLLVFPTAAGLGIKNAEINAAQNIGRWYAGSHGTAFRLTASPVQTASGATVYANAQLGKRLQGALGGTLFVLSPESPDGRLFGLRTFARAGDAARALGVVAAIVQAATGEAEGGSVDEADAHDLALEAFQEELLQPAGKRVMFFHDPSGQILTGSWAPQEVFWGAVHQTVTSRLRHTGRLHG